MKEHQKKLLKEKLPTLVPKIKALLESEGLGELDIHEMTFQPAIVCPTGQEPCLVLNPSGSGFHWDCVPQGACIQLQ